MKKYFIGLIAVCMALGISAFTAKPKATAFANKSFRYMNYPNDAFKNDPTHYQLGNLDDCTGQIHRCGVIAPSNGGSPERPVLTDPSVVILNKN